MMAFMVTHRTHEIGIRLALGARPRDVFRMVVRQGLQITFIGVVIGLLGAFALTRLMVGLLFGVSPIDPITFISVSMLLIIISSIACSVPARRATKVDPIIALRHE
jgi:putative ABC transport system permease protein